MTNRTTDPWGQIQGVISESKRDFEASRTDTRLQLQADTLRCAASKLRLAADLEDDLADAMEIEITRLMERADEIRAAGG